LKPDHERPAQRIEHAQTDLSRGHDSHPLDAFWPP
jgi:hypothetical protein